MVFLSYIYPKGSEIMRWHQNNIFKPSAAYWKRFIRTDYMTTGLIDVDAEMIQPGRFWLFTEDKNYRKKDGDAGDEFQKRIMQERCDSSKIPFLGLLTKNHNEQSPYVFLNQSTVYDLVTNVKVPDGYRNLPIDIVFFKWLDENNLFESPKERLQFIKTYNNSTLNFVRSQDMKQLRSATLQKSVNDMVVSWGVNNKIFTQEDLKNGTARQIIEGVKNILEKTLSQRKNFSSNCMAPTFEQKSGDNQEIYFLNSNGEIVSKYVSELLK